VLTVGPAVGAAPGTDVATAVADGAGTLVGNDVDVGSKASVARAMGEQAANPPRTPRAPTFNASLREILLFMAIPPKVKDKQLIGERAG